MADLKTLLFDTSGSNHPVGNYSNDFFGLVSSVLPTFYIVAGFILFMYMVAGGFMLMGSASDPHKAENGQKVMMNAIIGFAIIFTSYWIIQIVQVVTGVDILR